MVGYVGHMVVEEWLMMDEGHVMVDRVVVAIVLLHLLVRDGWVVVVMVEQWEDRIAGCRDGKES